MRRSPALNHCCAPVVLVPGMDCPTNPGCHRKASPFASQPTQAKSIIFFVARARIHQPIRQYSCLLTHQHWNVCLTFINQLRHLSVRSYRTHHRRCMRPARCMTTSHSQPQTSQVHRMRNFRHLDLPKVQQRPNTLLRISPKVKTKFSFISASQAKNRDDNGGTHI